MPDLNDFAKRIKVIADDVEQNADKLVNRVALVVDQTVVMATPVDTGRARANWVAEIGGPAEGVVEEFVAGIKGSTSGENARNAIAQAEAKIASRKPGQDVHITNNLAYIQALNDGHSAQAPANFVEQAIQIGVAAVKKAKLTTNPGAHNGRRKN